MAVGWLFAGLLLLMGMGGLVVVTDGDARTGVAVVDGSRPSRVAER
jgi:hypothetical protein